MSKFQVGDIVEAFGCRGVVVDIAPHERFPVKFKFADTKLTDTMVLYDYVFTQEGMYHEWATKPSLELIERPKKKVKVDRKVYMVIGLNKDGYIEDGAYAVKYTSYVDAGVAQDRFRILWPNLTWIVQEVAYTVELEESVAKTPEEFVSRGEK